MAENIFRTTTSSRTSPSTADDERYHDLRLAPVVLPEAYFTRRSAGLVTAARAKALARLEPCRSGTNSESYNRAAYNLRTPESHGPFFSSYINHGLDVAAPLLDHRNAHAGSGCRRGRASSTCGTGG